MLGCQGRKPDLLCRGIHYKFPIDGSTATATATAASGPRGIVAASAEQCRGDTNGDAYNDIKSRSGIKANLDVGKRYAMHRQRVLGREICNRPTCVGASIPEDHEFLLDHV